MLSHHDFLSKQDLNMLQAELQYALVPFGFLQNLPVWLAEGYKFSAAVIHKDNIPQNNKKNGTVTQNSVYFKKALLFQGDYWVRVVPF